MTYAEDSNLVESPHEDVTVNKTLLNKQNMALINSVKVALKVRLGQASMTVDELFKLEENSVVKLDQLSHAPLELMLNDDIIAEGELVVVDDHFGIQITRVIEQPKND